VRLAGVARLVGLEAAVPGRVMPGAESPGDPLVPLVLVSMAVLPVLVGGRIGGRDTAAKSDQECSHPCPAEEPHAPAARVR
jgi:hypothetical protein